MSRIDFENQSKKVKPSWRTRYGIASIFVGVLTIGIIIVVFYLELSSDKIGIDIENPIIFIPIIIGITVLPVVGIINARRGIIHKTNHRAVPFLGVILNSGLLLVAFIVFTIYFLFPTIKGRFLINGEPAIGAYLYLQPKCDHDMVYEDPSTWCDSGMAIGAQLRQDGSFTFYGLNIEPSSYSFGADIDLPGSISCDSMSRDYNVFTDDWRKDYTKVHVGYRQNLTFPSLLGRKHFLDIQLECQ
jgi:hypothetical protein